MSGMEPLAALGLACNIMQLLSFGGEAISLCRKIYKTGEIDPSLKDYSSQTAKICESLNDNLTQRQPNLGSDALALKQRATMCKAAADKLNHELQLLTSTSGASRWTRGFTTPIKAIRHQHHLSELEKDLNNLKSSLDTQLLVKIFDLVDPSKLKTEILAESKGLLATTLKQVDSGQKDLSQQIVKALEDAQKRLNAEIAATARDLQNERSRAQQEKIENEQRQDWDHLLKSLDFDTRAERVNMIRQEYSDTCRWIFKPSTNYGFRSWPCFTSWLQSEGPPIYWICGKPGSGKSTLMRFIASHESPTRDFLKQWQPGGRILSHYFWLAGSPMQNSIKGFLCSLVYQVLSGDISSALALLESNPDIKRKSCVTDWDPAELRRILISLTDEPGKAFCLFIDGLDELSPEESLGDLMVIIKELQRPRVKLCLSSRPDPAMKTYLGRYPTLLVHAFILDDIRRYADGILNRAMSHRNDAFEVDSLVDKVSYGADGVFLWAVLVARSLERGIEKGDSLQLLKERLRQMPKSLSKLYSSMWQRCEDDPETYQKGFSQFINIMNLAENVACLEQYGKVTLFEVMAATNTSFLNKYLTQDDQVPKDELKSLCHETRNSVEAWSAGLLMVTMAYLGNDRDSGPYKDLEFNINMTVEYVHRTARDFLLDEAEGQKLWKRVDVSREDLVAKLVKAALMRCQFWPLRDPQRPCLQDFFKSIDHSGSSGEAASAIHNPLPHIEKAFCKRYFERLSLEDILPEKSQREMEFLLAAANHGFCDYVFRRVQEMQQTGQLKAQDHASLLYALCRNRFLYRNPGNTFVARERLIQSLLSSGLPSFEKIEFSTDFNLSRSLLLRYLVSILQSYPLPPVAVDESVTTLAMLWKQAPSIENVYIRLVVWFRGFPGSDHAPTQLRIRNGRNFRLNGLVFVVLRVNVPYLVKAIGSLVHPSLCIPEILSKTEEPSAQAILFAVTAGALGVQTCYEISSDEDSKKIMECVTPLLHCKHGSDLQKRGYLEVTEWTKLDETLQQIAFDTETPKIEMGKFFYTETVSKRVNTSIDKLLGDKVTRVSPPWW